MKFDALEVAIEIVAKAKPLCDRIKNAELRNQALTAAISIPLNVAEANRRTGNDRANRFRIAAGSAAELVAAIRVGLSLGDLDEKASQGLLDLIDREQAMLYRLTHK